VASAALVEPLASCLAPENPRYPNASNRYAITDLWLSLQSAQSANPLLADIRGVLQRKHGWPARWSNQTRLRLEGGRAMVDYARRHLEGHIQYYGVSGNTRSVRCYVYQVARVLFKWLNRRSQRRSITWQRYAGVLAQLLPRARLVHNLHPQRL
jgi:hypothetical protein